MTRSRTTAGLAALTLAGLAIRGSVAFNGGFWRDEALLIGVIEIATWHQVLDYLRFHESHPPLFYAVMRIWRGIFGSSDTAALSLPILLSSAIIPTTFAVAASLFNRNAAWLGALLVCLASPLIGYGSSVRPYSFLAVSILLSTFCLARALESSRRLPWLTYSAIATVLIYTHNWSWLVIAGHTVSVIVVVVRERAVRERRVLGFSLSLFAAGVAFLPWISTLFRQAFNAGHFPEPIGGVVGWLELLVYASLITLNATLIPPLSAGRNIFLVAAAIAAGILLLGLRRLTSVRDKRVVQFSNPIAMTVFAVTPAAALGLALLVYPFTNLLIAACLSALAPVIVITGAALASRVAGLPCSRMGAREAIVLATVITIVGGYSGGIYDLLLRPRSNAMELVGAMDALRRPDDLVIVAPGWLVSPINHYSSPLANQIAFPDSGGSRLFDFAGTSKRLRDEAALARVTSAIEISARTGGRVWFVTDRAAARAASAEDRMSATQMRAPARIARVRVEDLRNVLTARFGQPVAILWPMKGLPLYEDMFAELYSAPSRGSPATPD